VLGVASHLNSRSESLAHTRSFGDAKTLLQTTI